MACHDYCAIKPMPPGTKSLLGLGLKYCIKRPRPTNKLDNTIDRFKNDVRRIHFFKMNPMEEDNGQYIPGLYIKSGWDPPLASDRIEDCIVNFERALRNRQAFYNKPSLSNLTPRHWTLIDELQSNDDHITIEADKNLGGCILDRSVYIRKGVQEHLGNDAVYKRLNKRQAFGANKILRYQVSIFLSKFQDDISAAEYTFLREATFKYPDKLARFRMSLKAHKTPWKMRPIVCCAGTFINCLSRWLDYWLQKCRPFVTTYLKDSGQLLDVLQDIGELPPTAKLFTADATSMYTNIDTNHAIDVIGKWLDSIANELPANFPLKAVKAAMVLVMKNNIFEWGDLYFLQLLGTAMGTSAACMWATIYFAVHEMGTLQPTYGHKMLLFKRFIDDIFGIWIDDGSGDDWQDFQRETNNFGILRWEFEELSESVNFLDLTITIKHNRITTRTFQKALNLYQYIPPNSAHPPGMMEGIIYGLMRNYRRQNTTTQDYNIMVIKLFRRHVARGWSKATMKEYILKAANRLNLPQTTTIQSTAAQTLPTNKERLFIHMEYHPNDISKKSVRAIYEQHCKSTFESSLGIKQTTIAYSRAPNLKDTLTKAKLHQAPGKEASKYYLGELTNC